MTRHDFTNRAALVTGAGRGIGQDIAIELARAGATVMVGDIDGEAAEATVALIESEGGTAHYRSVDVSDEQSVRTFVDATVKFLGALHLAVNNAAIGGGYGLAGEVHAADWQRIIDVNLTGTFICQREEIQAMLLAGGGSIVNMSSVLGIVGNATAVPYTAAKHGVVGLTRAAALGYATQGIRVNSVHPGYIDTPALAQKLPAEVYGELPSLHPVGRLGVEREVTDVVLFLLSAQASFVTGSQYVVDGGYSAR